CLYFNALIFLATCQLPTANCQQPTASDDHINILWADEFTYNVVGFDTLQKLVGNVELRQDTVFLFCDSAIIQNSTRVAAKGRFVLQHGKSTSIFADSATYRSDTKIADLFGDVSMKKGRQKLFTDHLTYDANSKIATYLTGATLTNDTTHLRSRRGYFHTKTDDIFFRDSVVVVSPDFTLKTDTLQFNASSQVATFLAPTLIVQDTAKIYTEAGFYDIDRKLAEFTEKPQYVKNDQKAWSTVMRYDGKLEEVTLLGEAHFEDSTSLATADVIRFNDKTQVSMLIGNASFQDEERTLQGDTVFYDAKNETYSTRGRSHIVDGSQILDADQVDYIKELEIGTAAGNVIWQDTTEHLTVVAEFAEHSKKKNYLKASGGKQGRPLLIKVVDKDSMFVSADTLMSFQPKPPVPDTSANKSGGNLKLPPDLADSLATPEIAADTTQSQTPNGEDSPGDFKSPGELADAPADTTQSPITNHQSPITNPQSPDSTRIILAFHDVRIFKKDLQGVCDSLSYSSLDSMFRLFKNPVLWSDTSQFTADTVQMQMANDKIDRIFLRNNSFIINSPDEFFFNQIKGKNSTAFFDSSEVRRVRVVGNAESVYYALDDQRAYIGVNKTICSEMLIFFGNNEVEGIRYYTQPKRNMIPMKKADHEGLKLPGFSWQAERRPRSVEDLFKKIPAGSLSQ
ncbi:MAG: OstA-like protein, partial [Bacteroidota bacterium]